MMLKVQQVFDATQVLANIIGQNRKLPTKGTYRVRRMHAALLPEFTTVNDQRNTKIAGYEHTNDDGLQAVPEDKLAEFFEWWNELASTEIEVSVEPIPIDQLCIDGAEPSISFAEFGTLGDLVAG